MSACCFLLRASHKCCWLRDFYAPAFVRRIAEILESIALQKGYKVYNHEGYTAFLKEVLHLSEHADKFDSFRKIRNGINYYGQKISVDEAEAIIEDIKNIIKKFQKT